MNILNVIVLVLMIIGALNWGLVGLFHFDAVQRAFTHLPAITRIIYIIVGLAGIYAIVFFHLFLHPHERPEQQPHTP